jgi:hypothetical protein
MVTALWVIGDQIDQKGIKHNAKEATWLEIPSALLRGEGGRNDNIWLRECLDRLTGLKINGDYRGDPWGAVIVAEWHIEQGGAVTRILIPPAAINALRAPETFAKIEAFAAYKLEGPAKRLYAALADKKRLSKSYWVFGVDEMRGILGVANKTAYVRFNNLKYRVLDPAIKQINDFGTVSVRMTPEKLVRTVTALRFDWQWKTIDEARETEEENEKHTMARRQPDLPRDAPPLTVASLPPPPPLTEEERRKRAEFTDKVLREKGLRK